MSKVGFELDERDDINYLAVVDAMIEEMSTIVEETEQTLITFEKFARCLLMSQTIDYKNSKPMEYIFNRSLTSTEKRFIAINLLRLLYKNDRIFDYLNIKIPTFQLFDDVFDELYKVFKINIKDQTYNKESKLKGVVSDIESEFRGLIGSINSLTDVVGIRQEFMQKINSQISRLLIQPFLPKEVLNVRLSELFREVEDYHRKSESITIHDHKKLKQRINYFKDNVRNFGTKYASDYLEGLANRILISLQRHFEESPVGKPANIVIKDNEKKYPLHIVGEKFRFIFLLENLGPGVALDSKFIVEFTDNISAYEPVHFLGTLKTMSLLIEVPCVVKAKEDLAFAFISVEWTNTSGEMERKTFEVELKAQRSNIDWSQLNGEDPYSLEPVSSDEDLVGRADILQQLIVQAQAKNIGSSYLYGQKRVGKTSIVKALKTRLTKLQPNDFLIVYLDLGDCIYPDAKTNVENLGKWLCKEIKTIDCRFAMLPTPSFEGALAPFAEFLDDIKRIAPKIRVVFIFDEFDELPVDLFKREAVGNALFLTLRSISSKEPFGFILVGGEKMEFVKSWQGDKLNKFQLFRIDYFDKEKYFSDFQDLVKRPVADWFEFTDEAVVNLYEQTAGNPYFTKLICRSLFEMMIKRRDAHVTSKEIDDAVNTTIENVRSNSFQHFWEDGIIDSSGRAEDISVNRRKILISLGEISKHTEPVPKNSLKDRAAKYGLTEQVIDAELRDFERRKVLVSTENMYSCKSPFFQEWLKQYGITEIMTTFADYDSYINERKKEQDAYVRPEEITQLVARWGVYHGQKVSSDDVRVWLNQFGDNLKQRLMFKILQHLKFYSGDTIRQKMREVHKILIRDFTQVIKEGKRKRNDILISYLDGPGKSGAYCAKLYADENEIYAANVVEKSKLLKYLSEKSDIKAIVFIDDFVATGDSVSQYLNEMLNEIGEQARGLKIKLYFMAICGFENAIMKVEETIEQIGISVRTHVCDIFDEKDRCFSDESKVFPDVGERQNAKKLAYDLGVRLVKKDPLGYCESQAIVVFETNCPNNSLPIIWKEEKDWKSLFKRQV